MLLILLPSLHLHLKGVEPFIKTKRLRGRLRVGTSSRGHVHHFQSFHGGFLYSFPQTLVGSGL